MRYGTCMAGQPRGEIDLRSSIMWNLDRYVHYISTKESLQNCDRCGVFTSRRPYNIKAFQKQAWAQKDLQRNRGMQ